MSDLHTYFVDQQQAMIDLLTEIVNFETPSHDKAAVDRLVDHMAAKLNGMGTSSVTRYPQDNVGDFLLAKWNEEAPGKPILAIMHLDTVWPIGTLADRPVTLDSEGRLYGPGAVDMKAGITTLLTAISGQMARDALPERPIWAFFNTDEEIGSKTSTPVIKEVAEGCGLVLVMEPGTSDGSLKTRRKGLASYHIHAKGLASHAGNEPEQGVNAIIELAQQMLKLHKLNDLRNSTSVSVTMVDGGSGGNVIPAAATAFVDTRVLTMQEMERVKTAINDLYPMMPGAELTIEPGHTRPPMEHNQQMQETFARCKAIGEAHGLSVREESVGGGSDGNTTAAMGIPTLDGMGSYGGGLHALHEHVLISSLSHRATLIAAILKDWPAD